MSGRFALLFLSWCFISFFFGMMLLRGQSESTERTLKSFLSARNHKVRDFATAFRVRKHFGSSRRGPQGLDKVGIGPHTPPNFPGSTCPGGIACTDSVDYWSLGAAQRTSIEPKQPGLQRETGSAEACQKVGTKMIGGAFYLYGKTVFIRWETKWNELFQWNFSKHLDTSRGISPYS